MIEIFGSYFRDITKVIVKFKSMIYNERKTNHQYAENK